MLGLCKTISQFPWKSEGHRGCGLALGGDISQGPKLSPKPCSSCRALVVEDAVHGVHAAKGAGAYVVGITNSLPRSLLAEHADAVIDTLLGFDPRVAPRGV